MALEILEKLNEVQKKAVQIVNGPILVIAGAGSGKTKLLTHRVAYLAKEAGIAPKNILAVTFTNKAADEMKERLRKLLRDQNIGTRRDFGFNIGPHIGTFHSICVRILRRDIDKLGYGKNFNILDENDQLTLMKKVFKDQEISLEQFNPKAIRGSISKLKNELIGSESIGAEIGGYYEKIVARLYEAYQKKLKESNSLDFDDIIMLTVKIFEKFPEILEKYQELFRYILVDEYQDTNHAQYTLIKLLAKKYKNVCVVGDDFQSIYSWRGADIKNILDFEKDYPNAKVIKLEQNYRSTQIILDAAYGIISKNVFRTDKKLWTEIKGEHLITSYEADDETDEANFAVSEIKTLAEKHGYRFSDFVILYRTNAQSRSLEEAFLQAGLKYRIVGGIKFYQRKEIKDIIAYLKLAQNRQDIASLERIINAPHRGIGPISMGRWLEFSAKNELDPIEAAASSNFESIGINQKKLESIKRFSEFIGQAGRKIEETRLENIIKFAYQESGYEKSLMDGTEENETRMENIKELLTVAKKYEDYSGEESLHLFLEEAALISDTDNINQNEDAVHLMTLHSAKGLEFKIVFIVGLEEGILPHSRSMLDENEMEEERRLMYVGVTRAKEKVYLIFTRIRNIYGGTQANPVSRFIEDIPQHLITRNLKPETSSLKRVTGYKLRVTGFKDGEKVKHPTFGNGIIVASEGDILTVAFSKAGLKKLSATIAPLKKIG